MWTLLWDRYQWGNILTKWYQLTRCFDRDVWCVRQPCDCLPMPHSVSSRIDVFRRILRSLFTYCHYLRCRDICQVDHCDLVDLECTLLSIGCWLAGSNLGQQLFRHQKYAFSWPDRSEFDEHSPSDLQLERAHDNLQLHVTIPRFGAWLYLCFIFLLWKWYQSMLW